MVLKQSEQAQVEQDAALESEAGAAAARLRDGFAETRATVLITAHNPAFRDFYRAGDDRYAKIVGEGRTIDRVNGALLYLDQPLPREHRRGLASSTVAAPRTPASSAALEDAPSAARHDVSTHCLLQTRARAPARSACYQSRPTSRGMQVSGCVVLDADPGPSVRLAARPRRAAIESLRTELRGFSNRYEIVVVDAAPAPSSLTAAPPQETGANLGVPDDDRFRGLAGATGDGVRKLDDLRDRLPAAGRGRDPSNHWIVVASAPRVRAASLVGVNSLPHRTGAARLSC